MAALSCWRVALCVYDAGAEPIQVGDTRQWIRIRAADSGGNSPGLSGVAADRSGDRLR